MMHRLICGLCYMSGVRPSWKKVILLQQGRQVISFLPGPLSRIKSIIFPSCSDAFGYNGTTTSSINFRNSIESIPALVLQLTVGPLSTTLLVPYTSFTRGRLLRNYIWIRLFSSIATDLSWKCGGKGRPAAVLLPINMMRVLLLFVQAACGTAGFEEPNWVEERPPLFVWLPWRVRPDLSRFKIWFNWPEKKTSSPSPSSSSCHFLANPLVIKKSFNI